ncbi:MAG: hypothetical protein ACI4RP_01235 [Acutalibacteraceae bacterium]
MRCLYREKKYYCGEYLEVDIFPVFEKQRSRGKKRKPTSETQKLLNQRNAERKLIRLLNTNFTKKDIRFDLTYSEENRPASAEDAQKQMQNFIRRLKRFRKKKGLPELKYVAVTEIGKKTARVHHHIVMSGGVDINDLAEIWGKGYTTAKPLQFNEYGIVGIAKYLVKEPVLGKRWCASRNLEAPKTSERDGRLSKRKVKEIHDLGNDNRKDLERLYDGYYLADCRPFYNEINGGYYVTVRMYKKQIQTKQKYSDDFRQRMKGD